MNSASTQPPSTAATLVGLPVYHPHSQQTLRSVHTEMYRCRKNAVMLASVLAAGTATSDMPHTAIIYMCTYTYILRTPSLQAPPAMADLHSRSAPVCACSNKHWARILLPHQLPECTRQTENGKRRCMGMPSQIWIRIILPQGIWCTCMLANANSYSYG